MKICKVCKIENEDQFVYCKNCGTQLEVIAPLNEEVEVLPLEETSVSYPPSEDKSANNPYENMSVAEPYAKSEPKYTSASLVPVKMLLPDPYNPEMKTIQTVYVTPAQRSAIQYDILKQKNK